ncbi:MAG: 6-phospho-beta-glucosidase [Anaerolineaceae bacterium]|nr:6-phospho-beta-glucosidase [Anaerolineaceae bacterium]
MLKVTIIGGGSTYTPEIIQGFLSRVDELPVDEIWLMDIDESRLQIVGGLIQRMVAAAGNPFTIHLTLDRKEAIQNANYIITQFRVGQMEARRKDEYLGKDYGLVGQETTGVGGMAKALRTIPVMLDIANEIRTLAPDALLLNFTNPSGLITEALNRYARDISVVGVCNSAYTTKMNILEKLTKHTGEIIHPDQAQLLGLGLNHLSWYYGFEVNGEDRWDDVFGIYLQELRESETPMFTPGFIRKLGMMPNYYLEYYYETERKLEEQEKWPPSRAEQVMEIEKELLAAYREPDRTQPPESLMQRGGSYYSTVATQLINAHYNDLDEIHICNVRHNGVVRGWEKSWVLELPCRVNATGIHPIPTEPLPLYNYVLLEQVKNYELMTIEAAVHGDVRSLHLALAAHPLGPPEDQSADLIEDLLRINRSYLPQFFPASV